MADPIIKSVANVDPYFEARITDMQMHAQNEASARQLGGQVRWFRPQASAAAVGWPGEVFDLGAFSAPFSRAASNADYINATKDPDNPGTTGDVVASTLQVDYLALLERAFRNRHTMRRPRAMAHMTARVQGHGNVSGPLAGMIAQVREALRLAKEPPL